MDNAKLIGTLIKTQEKCFEVMQEMSSIIDEEFTLLAQYATMEELEPLINEIESTAKTKEELKEWKRP